MKMNIPLQTARFRTKDFQPEVRLNGSSNRSFRLRRDPMDRMLRIHDAIAGGAYPNSHGLAAELETSPKTIKRDIEFMRQHWELPITYDEIRHGYFYSSTVKTFPGTPGITEAELFAMLVAHKALAAYQGTPFHAPLRMAFQKLSTMLNSKERYTLENLHDALSFRPFAPEDSDLRVFDLVTRALKEQRALVFEYRKPGKKTGESRRAYPYHLTCSDNRWYLLGFDTVRQAVRTFAIGRITHVSIAEDRFLKPLNFDPNLYLRDSFAVMKGEGDYEVVIELDAWAADQARGRQWHSSQRVAEVPGGGARLHLRLSGLEEIERWVLSWGIHATVIAPETLATKIRTTTSAVAEKYQRM